MAIAAVPEYLGRNFEGASPGMRFGMYMPIWRRNWEKEQYLDWQSICAVGNEKTLIEALIARQNQQVASQSSDHFCLSAQSTAPFTTGLGNEHPLENGFAFLWPYGIPYLPGSGVKGVLRQAARELKKEIWDSAKGWHDEKPWQAKVGKETITLSLIDLLFGLESKDRQKEHFRGVLTFWDVIPEINGSKLMVEIMTPHQTHYYQNGEPPHDSGQPVPIQFLTVPPESKFQFHVVCDTARLRHIAPELLEETDGKPRWKVLIEAAFEHAFEWLGFGAKTAMGYGAMQRDEQAEQRHREAAEKVKVEAERQRALEEAVAGLPEDAAQIERWRQEPLWDDNNTFFKQVEPLLEHTEHLSPEACQKLREEMESRWKGIMENPDATKGKKNKPKYKDRPRNLAKKIMAICTGENNE